MTKENSKPQLHRLIKERNVLMERLSQYRHIIRGTIIERGNICGKPHCRCKRKETPILHGPYRYLSHRAREKTNMIFLNRKKLLYARKGIKEYHVLIQLIYKISEINFKIVRYYHHKLSNEIYV